MTQNRINGKNFMFYVECETLTGSVMLPLCEAKSVQLQFQSDVREATKDPESKWKSFYYGRNSYSLSLDGFITYSDEDINQLIITVQERLLTVNDKLVSIGGAPFNPGGGYFCLENALFDWKVIKWAFESIDTPMKWRGEVLIDQLSASFNADGNSLAEFSTSLQGNGKPERFHTPTPTDLKVEGTSDTFPTEDAGAFSIAPVKQGSTWLAGVQFTGEALPGGNFMIDTGHNYTLQIGDTVADVAKALASKINATPSLHELSAYADDDTLYIVMDANQTVTGTYTNHTGTLKTVYLSFNSKVNYDFYRVKVVQASNEWYIDVGSTKPGIILPTGTYTLSVSGMGQDLQYSDYSDTINVTI